MNNDRILNSTSVQITTNLSNNDLTSIHQYLSTTFHSKDSALGLSDEHIHQNVNNDPIKLNETSKDSFSNIFIQSLNISKQCPSAVFRLVFSFF